MEQIRSCKRAGGDWLKEGEGVSQKTHMKDARTWTTVWGLSMVVGVGCVEQGEGRKMGQLQQHKE